MFFNKILCKGASRKPLLVLRIVQEKVATNRKLRLAAAGRETKSAMSCGLATYEIKNEQTKSILTT